MSSFPSPYRCSATKIWTDNHLLIVFQQHIWADSYPLIVVQQQRYELNPIPLSLFSKKDMSWLPSSYRCSATKIWTDSHLLIVDQQQRYELTPIPYRCSATKIIKWTKRIRQTFPTLAWRIWPSRMISLTNYAPVRWLMADDFCTWWSRNKVILGRRLPTLTLTTYRILAVALRRWLWYSMAIATQQKIMITSVVPWTHTVTYKFDRTWYILPQILCS